MDGSLYIDFDSIIECSYNRQIEITDYPFEGENGVMSRATEYAFDRPNTIDMVGIATYDSIAGELAAKAVNAVFDTDLKSKTSEIQEKLNSLTSGIYKVNIQTRSGLRENYTLQSFSIVENFSNYNQLQVKMTFKQVIEVDDWNGKQRDAENNDTVNNGNVAAKEV